MCVIIQRDKMIHIPFEKIKVACTINRDGYGFVINDRDKFSVIKSCNAKGNDPDAVFKLLEDAKDCDVALHLRFRTAGKIDEENAHPYQVLSKAEDGIDLWFMHNGTLNQFKQVNEDYSDSRNLNNVVLKDLMRTAYKNYGDEYLDQKYLHIILKHLKNDTSAFTFNDSNGNRLILPSTLSKEFEGWWASNDYSFREAHPRYTPPAKTVYLPAKTQGQSVGNFTKDTNPRHLPTTTSHGKNTAPAGQDSKGSIKKGPFQYLERLAWEYTTHSLPSRCYMTTKIKMEADYIRNAINLALDPKESDLQVVKISPAMAFIPTFEQISGVKDINDLNILSFDDLVSMCQKAPEASAILLTDLLHRLDKNRVRPVASAVIEQVA